MAKRLDIVWDTYIPGSLKEFTRDKRGKGVHRKMSGLTKLPTNWMDFLHDPKNKEELFSFLTLSLFAHHTRAFTSHQVLL